MTHDYERLLDGDPALQERARKLGERVHDLVRFLAGPALLPAGSLDNGDRTRVTVHRFCQSGNVLGQGDEMPQLIRRLAGVQVLPLRENGVCCGFGGSTSMTAPEVAAGILSRKMGCVDESGAEILVTDNPGCMMHMRGGVDASHRKVRVMHFAEYLAGRLPRE
jgi:Fe-S oxidoreductase